MYKNLVLPLIFLGLISCGKQEKKEFSDSELENETGQVAMGDFPDTIEIPIESGDNSQNSLDWEGTYRGILPCADCEGIETKITLSANGTYEYKASYLGKNDALEESYTGPFVWDEKGSEITLAGLGGASRRYKVGEGKIWHLDNEGNVIKGDLAQRYILKKE